MNKTFIQLLLIFSFAASASAQVDTLMRDSTIDRYRITEGGFIRIGPAIHYGANIYRSSTLPTPLSNGCDSFVAGTKGGLGISLNADIPFTQKNDLFLRTRAGYYDIGGSLRYSEIYTDTVSGQRRSSEFEHTITTFTKSLMVDLLIAFDIIPKVTIDAGVVTGLLFGQRYEKVMSAVGAGGFAGGARDSLENSGGLPDAETLQFAVTGGAEMRFPLSSKLDAVTRIDALLPINGTTKYLNNWRIGGSIGISLPIYGVPDTVIETEIIKVPEYVIREKPKPPLSAVIEAFGRDAQGSLEKVIRISVEDVKARVAFPFLGYIFFDESSAVIPPRYILYGSTEEAERKFVPVTDREDVKILPLYHDLLNILGSRMRAMPSSKITLTGMTSNTGTETNNLALARRRAETVKGYLVNIWKIAAERITVDARLMPQKPSPLASRQGQEENRRVEITSNDDRLTDPIIATNIEHVATPSGLVLQPRIITEAGLRTMTARIMMGGKEIERFIGDETGFRQQSTWTISEDALSSADSIMKIVLEVIDSADSRVETSTMIPIERIRTERDKEQSLERYSLILFGFDEDELGTKNERTISLVAESVRKLKPKFVNVIGYTDETGSESYNDELSRRRALKALLSLEKSLKQKKITLPASTSVDGRGSRDRLYDNTLPEGRFFSRTVNITLGAQK